MVGLIWKIIYLFFGSIPTHLQFHTSELPPPPTSKFQPPHKYTHILAAQFISSPPSEMLDQHLSKGQNCQVADKCTDTAFTINTL